MTRSAGRRAALAAIAAGVLAPLARAQDPRSAAAQDAARAWLAIVDRFDIEGSFAAAGDLFREALKADGWVAAMRQVRQPLGAVVQRTAVRTSFSNEIAGKPAGEFALITFRSSFANQDVVRELVTLEVDGYRWRVVGYSIQR